MRYEQAFHTCCRNGRTSATLAFQYNAASDGLDDTMLAGIQNAMTGYAPPRSAPPAPTPDELYAFPVSLRYRAVEGVGPSVSRTAYVGREDRSPAGAGEGRFGNYFSHVLVAPGAERFFPNRRPIELWEAPVWTTDEQPAIVAPSLEGLTVGTDVAHRAFAALEEAGRIDWLPSLLDGVARALEGESRVVVLDEPGLGWAWVAAASFALPAVLADRLTFDTYAADPHLAKVLLCASVRDVDRHMLDHKAHTGEVLLLDPASAPVPGEQLTLLGRGAASLCERGGASRLSAIGEKAQSDAGMTPARLGARFAIEAQDPSALRTGDLVTVLGEVAPWIDGPARDDEGLAAATVLLAGAAAEPGLEVDPAAAHDAARLLERAAAADAAPDDTISALACVALRGADNLEPGTLATVPPAMLGFDAIGQALDLVSDSLDAGAAARRLGAIAAIGLLGANDELDRRAGDACASHIEDRQVLALLTQLAADARGRSCVENALWSVAQERTSLSPDVLATLGRPPVIELLTGLAKEQGRYPAALLAGRATVSVHPDVGERVLGRLLLQARSPEECDEAVAAIYGDWSDWSLEKLGEVVAAHGAAERLPAEQIVEAGWDRLADIDPVEAVARDATRELGDTLKALAPQARERPAYIGLVLARQRSPSVPEEWLRALEERFDELPERHAEALAGYAARDVAVLTDTTVHAEAVDVMTRAAKRRFVDPYIRAIERSLGQDRDPALACAVLLAWYSRGAPVDIAPEVSDKVLPRLMGVWDDEDRDRLAALIARREPGWIEWFHDWREEHPPAGAVGRAVRRMRLGRRS